MAYLQVGRTQEARALLREAIDTGLPFTGMEDAKAASKTLIALR
jgi:hypothetical protein